MSKNQTVGKNSDSFSLLPLKPDCYYKIILADFTPPPSLNIASNSIVPAFLLDRNFFTPAFIVSRQKQFYESTSSVERMKFEARIQKAKQLCEEVQNDEERDIQISPPAPTTNYCQICKCGYQQYQEHLKESSHKRDSRFSKSNIYISQLCKKYCKKSKDRNKKKQIEKKIQVKESVKKKVGRRQKDVEQRQCQQKTKHNNYSTQVPSVVPTSQC